MCQGFVTSFAGLVVCRFLLGCFEAGLAPGWFLSDSQSVEEHALLIAIGCAYIIGMYYKRYEMQKRFTVYNTAGIIAGAFGGVRRYSVL